MIGAGRLNRRVAFDAPTETANGQGGVISGWALHCQIWAGFRFLRGGETVQAARLAGRQPVVVTIRKSATTDQITAAFRMRDLRTGVVYNVRSIAPTENRAFYEVLAESGVAV